MCGNKIRANDCIAPVLGYLVRRPPSLERVRLREAMGDHSCHKYPEHLPQTQVRDNRSEATWAIILRHKPLG